MLGLSYPGGKFLQVWEQIFEHITETRLWDCILGLSCMVVLLILRVSVLGCNDAYYDQLYNGDSCFLLGFPDALKMGR